ncbi:MAG: helix-turn-helix domain-containing protein [Pseudomonadales bacterium]
MEQAAWTTWVDAALAGQCALVISQLALTRWRQPWHLPLMLVFAGAFIGELVSVFISTEYPVLGKGVLFLTAANFLAIGSLWIYVAMLTAPQPILRPWRYYRHLWPAPLSLLLLIPFFLLPAEEGLALVRNGNVVSDGQFRAAVGIVLGEILWEVWTLIYLVAIVRRLSRYRQRLRDFYASTEQRELWWITALVVVVFCFWLLQLTSIVGYFGFEIEVPPELELVVGIAVIWIPALWGLQQMPALAGQASLEPQAAAALPESSAQQGVDPVAIAVSDEPGKYARSALSQADAARIAAKIGSAMESERLYRDPGLSLTGLSQSVGVSANYVSQTINTLLGESFFEYVNRLRAAEAETLLRSTDHTALRIAYDCGFNSRSSFYTAFKKHYGAPPAAYRKQLSAPSGPEAS